MTSHATVSFSSAGRFTIDYPSLLLKQVWIFFSYMLKNLICSTRVTYNNLLLLKSFVSVHFSPEQKIEILQKHAK